MDLEDEIDYYDLINAPQYLDFNELVRNNGILDEADPADSFFGISDPEEDGNSPRESNEPEDFHDGNIIPKTQDEEQVSAPLDLSMTPQTENDDTEPINTDTYYTPLHTLVRGNIPMEPQIETQGHQDGPTQEINELESQLSQMALKADVEQSKESTIQAEQIPTPKSAGLHNLNLSLQEPIGCHSEPAIVAEENKYPVEESKPLKRKKESIASTGKPGTAQRRPLNSSLPSLYKSAASELSKKTELKKITVAKPFNFHETRTRQIVIHKEEPFKFKARAAPIKAVHGTSKETTAVKTCTLPLTPHFASDARIRARHIRATTPVRAESPNENNRPPSPCSSTASHDSRSKIPRTTPAFRAPSPSVRVEKKCTVVKPFSFEERDKEFRRIRAEKIRQEMEAAAKVPEFHAKPRPSFSRPKGVPKKKFVELTNVEPFKLKADERGAMYQEALRRKMEEEERLRQEQATFHANPPTVIFKKPFEPEPSQKPLACPLDPQLNSDKRAQERELYDQYLKQKEEFMEQQKMQEEEERAEMEKEMELEKRRQLVHKANPMKAFRTFQIRSSARPLTTPMSPAFAPLPSQRRKNLHGD